MLSKYIVRYICRCYWNVVIYKWQSHNGKIETLLKVSFSAGHHCKLLVLRQDIKATLGYLYLWYHIFEVQLHRCDQHIVTKHCIIQTKNIIYRAEHEIKGSG
jgi:hypothetical protein